MTDSSRPAASEPRKIAAIVTTFFANSHADVIVTKFARGFPTDDGLLPPQVEVASMYMDQTHANDIGQSLARDCGIPIYQSIPATLCLGGNELAVDGVLSIGEHGDYACNEKGQRLYPRRHFLEQICGVLATSGRVVPVFSDKHLACTWSDALWVYDRARQLGVPFMAGSSVPLFWRDPWLEHELGAPIQEALIVSYGDLEAYGYHAFEALQAMVERRQRGETGIAAVQCLEGDDVWKAGKAGKWSAELAEAASALGGALEGNGGEDCDSPAAFLIEYADGLRATVLHLPGHIRRWAYAALVDGQVQATGLRSGREPFPHFSYLGLNIQEMFLTGLPQYPVERTLLVTGGVAAIMDSRHEGHVRLETPHLDVTYAAPETAPIRPAGPQPIGASTIPM
jgi:hypothetical protein